MVRMCERLGILVLIWKKVDDDSASKENVLFCIDLPDFEDFSALTTNKYYFKVTLLESLLNNRDHSPLNKNNQSLRLELFNS